MAADQREELIYELTPAQEQQQLNEAAAPLLEQNVPAACFNRDAAIEKGFTFRKFLKLVRGVARLSSVGVLPEALAVGTMRKLYTVHTAATLEQFVKFARFLATREGQDEVYKLQQDARIKRKASDAVTPEQVMIQEVFSAMRQDFARDLKEMRRAHESKIDKLRVELRKAERDLQKVLDDVKMAFAPASMYVEPTAEEVDDLAWQLYEAQAERDAKRPKAKFLGGMDYARAHFGHRARELKSISYASDPKHRDDLVAYLKRKLLAFRADANISGARKVAHQLATIGGEQAVNEALAEEAMAERRDRGGHAPAAATTAGNPPSRRMDPQHPGGSK